MRDIILMADGARKVYSVPEAAAENLEKYCLDFCDKWLWTSPDAAESCAMTKGILFPGLTNMFSPKLLRSLSKNLMTTSSRINTADAPNLLSDCPQSSSVFHKKTPFELYL